MSHETRYHETPEEPSLSAEELVECRRQAFHQLGALSAQLCETQKAYTALIGRITKINEQLAQHDPQLRKELARELYAVKFEDDETAS